VRFGGKTIAQPLVFRNRAGEELIFSGNFAPRPDVTACELRRADLPVYIAGLEKMDRFVKLQYVHLPGKSDWVGYDSGRFEELKELLGTDHVRIATIAWCIDANGREFMALKDLQPPPENPPFELE